jgi:hypothetical protein
MVALVGVSIVSSLDDPEVGDCVKTTGDTGFEVVDCGTDEAQFRIVGVEKDEQTEVEFQADTEACTAFPSASVTLWNPGTKTMYGTVYCAEDL